MYNGLMNNESISNVNQCPRPAATVRTVDSIGLVRRFTNTLVFVRPINTTFYVDTNHQATIVFAGPVFQDGYDYQTNPLGVRSQTVYDFRNNLEIVYNGKGEYRVTNMEKQ